MVLWKDRLVEILGVLGLGFSQDFALPGSPASLASPVSPDASKTALTGKFLHITDIHLDRFYKENSDPEQACHKGHSKKHKVGKYGAPMTDCDSPWPLVEATFQWIEDNLKGKIDFIIWTGDNARHDSDIDIPRTPQVILDLNKNISTLMQETFPGDPTNPQQPLSIPIVPSVGNNDVFPHNLFAPGPSAYSYELARIWNRFVPEREALTMMRDINFVSIVIPGKLAVVSLNTLYWFSSNPVVDGCDDKSDPGYQQLKWLGIVLKELRSDGLKVWLSGHVPPVSKNYENDCLDKLSLWLHEYSDIIVGGMYGHMNIDHYSVHDTWKSYKKVMKRIAAKEKTKKGKRKAKSVDQKVLRLENGSDNVMNVDLDFLASLSSEELDLLYENADDIDFPLADLIEEDEDEDDGDAKFDYDLSQYNITDTFVPMGLDKTKYFDELLDSYKDIKGPAKWDKYYSRYSLSFVSPSVIPNYFPTLRVWEYNTTGVTLDDVLSYSDTFKEAFDSSSNSDTSKKKKKKRDKSIPKKYRKKNAKIGPAYVNQAFSPLGYTQYFANLTAINNKEHKFKYEVEYRTDDFPYEANGFLSVERLVDLTLMMSKKKGHGQKAWKRYLENAYVSTNYVKVDSENSELSVEDV